MAEKKLKTEIVIEEFVLVNNEKQTTYTERNVTVQPISIGKNGTPVFRVMTEDGVQMGTVGDSKKLEKTREYDKHLIEKLGISNYKLLALDSSNIEADVQQMIKEQKELEEQQRRQEIEREQERAREAERMAEEKAAEQEKNKEEQEVKNPERTENNNQETKNGGRMVLTQKELGQHQLAIIKDMEFARNIVPNSDEYNFHRVCVAMIDGKPKVLAQRNDDPDKYEELPTYMDARTEMGKIDSLENGEEKEDIEKGQVITMLDRNGNQVKIDARLTSGGEMEIRDVSKDRDGDGDKEGARVETRTYNPARPPASKVADKDLTNEKKKEMGIETEEINNGPLTREQIESLLENKDDDVRDEVLDRLDDDKLPTQDEFNKLVEDVEYDIEFVPGYGEHQRKH